MIDIMTMYRSRRDEWERALTPLGDVNAACDGVRAFLESLKRDCLDACESAAERARIDACLSTAIQAAGCMLAVSKADARVRPRLAAPAREEKWRRYLAFAPAFLAFALTAWLTIDGQTAPAVLALACAVTASLRQILQRPAEALPPDVEAAPRVDGYELMRALDRLMQAASDGLHRMNPEDASPRLLPEPVLSRDLYGAMQMLYEAGYTADGGYALRTLPALDAALREQGVEVVPYSEAEKDAFEVFPSDVGGVTIRPAMRRDGQILARGQATIQT